jgi:hypothetical protein
LRPVLSLDGIHLCFNVLALSLKRLEGRKMSEDEYGMPEQYNDNKQRAIDYFNSLDHEKWIDICTTDRQHFVVFLASNDAAIILVNAEIRAWVPKELLFECIGHMVEKFLNWRIEK